MFELASWGAGTYCGPMLRGIQWVISVAMALTVLHGLWAGQMRVKGAGLYSREKNPRGYWFMVVTHAIAAGLFAWMAYVGIPP